VKAGKHRSANRRITDASRRFGTFGGVFVPTTLTILGVIMFMRTGYVTGYAGVWLALAVLGLSKLITGLTTLSLSAIATNQDVKVGGVYFMISRVLGPEFGGSIGLTLFVAQAVAVAFYVIGFTEALVNVILPLAPDLAPALTAYRLPQIVSSLVVILLFLLTFKGADVAIKAQYVVLAILLLAVASYVVGGVLRYDPDIMSANLSPAFTSEVGFWQVFAIFFPAATGITAGANMSGDLKNPGRAIPLGTLAAMGLAALVYALQIFLMSGTSDHDALTSDPFGALTRMSLWGPLVMLGVFAATLSSAIASFLGAPRILQAMGQDRLMRLLVFFGKGSGRASEPRRATVLTFVIAIGIIWAGDLNAVAEVISMFFLIAYGMVNLSAFVESRGGNPSFRPRFRLFHWTTALAGAVGCAVAMLKINTTYALVAMAVAGLLYFYLVKRDIKATWGDAKRGYIFGRTRDNLLYLERTPPHPKNWRPIVKVISASPEGEPQLLEVASWIESERGLLTVTQITEQEDHHGTDREVVRKQAELDIRAKLDALQIVAFPQVVITPDFHEGLSVVLQSHAVPGLRPNTIMLSMPHAQDPDGREHFHRTMDVVSSFDLNLLVLKPGWIQPDRTERTIDLWWRGERNGSLMALAAYLVSLNDLWSEATIRIFRIIPRHEDGLVHQRQLEDICRQSRIRARPSVVRTDEPPLDVIRKLSSDSDLVLLGMSAAAAAGFSDYLETMDPLLEELPTTILVWSNGQADLFA
jgi:amino acid transporter